MKAQAKVQTTLTACFALYMLLNVQPAHAANLCVLPFGGQVPMQVKKADGSVETVLLGKIRQGQVPSVDSSLLGQAKLHSTVPESSAIKRRPIDPAMEGQFKPVAIYEDETGTVFGPSGTPSRHEGTDYYEKPNSTTTSVVDEDTGHRRVWKLTRGIRYYTNHVNRLTGEQSPRGYVSDLLLYEVVNGKDVFHSVFIRSSPEHGSLIEDPRWMPGTRPHLREIGVTDYSDHTGNGDKDVMNRTIEIRFDRRGAPIKPVVDPITHRPVFKDISPEPQKNPDGSFTIIDAKNGTKFTDPFTRVTYLFSRMRPDFKDTHVANLFGKAWAYAHQVFGFKSRAESDSYDMSNAMKDLAGKQVSDRQGAEPLFVTQVLTDSELNEYYIVDPSEPGTRIKIGDKGTGPGPTPRLYARAGDLLLMSDDDGLGMVIVGKIPNPASYPIASGTTVIGQLGHEILKYYQEGRMGDMKRRFYTATMMFFSTSGVPKMTAFRPHVVQPLTKHELGYNSGIMDLAGHFYFMGLATMDDAKGRPVKQVPLAVINGLHRRYHAMMSNPGNQALKTEFKRFEAAVEKAHGIARTMGTAGASDAHTIDVDIDQVQLLQDTFDFTAEHGLPGQK